MAVRIGFIGTGGIAGHHISLLSKNVNAELTAFSDPDVDRASAAARTYGGKPYKSYRTMLAKADLDAVFICIPPFAHSDQERRAIEAGCALFVEKPIGLNMRRVERNAELIESKNVVSSVGYNWRYADSTQSALRRLEHKNISLVSGSWMGGVPGVYWWRQMNLSGGQTVEQTTHVFDLARYLIGEVESVYASGSRGAIADDEMPNYDVHDASVVQLRFTNGAVGNISSACILPQGGPVELNVYARDISVTIKHDAVRVITQGKEELLSNASNATVSEHEAFLAAVEGRPGPPILSSYSDAMETLRVTLAANRSMTSGRPVTLQR
jgi:myo-inositol 2-dehydrogenase / D-chiro-inositol 1-dehydrogenase